MLDAEERGRVLSDLSQIRQAGFTLVELLIGIAVLAILITVAMPNFRSWTLNSQIRNAAESFRNGLQRARGEAVSRNTNVELAILGGDTSTAWEVRLPGSAVIDSRASSEGSRLVKRTVTPAGATTVTFSNLGRLTANSGAAAAFTLVEFDLDPAILEVRLSRELRVMVVGPAGSVRMCDPNAAPGSLSVCP